MDTVYDKMNADKKNVLVLKPKSGNADEVSSFQLMAAQIHVARVLQMLKDHRQELDNLKIVKLHLIHETVTGGKGANQIMIELAR